MNIIYLVPYTLFYAVHMLPSCSYMFLIIVHMCMYMYVRNECFDSTKGMQHM